ncbi:hypothetical protein L1987_16450 [Smallanthus sonchifolius]|uniref:Uncharacterized protein n=1 Tax=Smallanthus sonchifolius TaxID=185202 RepID=A0ACB9JAI2_9ASTR|nr:hypothetical protein L1987_16450 [Smallanthus sonchifolius]
MLNRISFGDTGKSTDVTLCYQKKWDGQCPEYSGEEQAICAVGLVKTKHGFCVEAIQYLLVLATPVELLLIGSDPYYSHYLNTQYHLMGLL